MDTKQKIMNSTAISRLLGVRYIYLGLGTTLATSLIPFTAISSYSVLAAPVPINSSQKLASDFVTANIRPEIDTSLTAELVKSKSQTNYSKKSSKKVKLSKSFSSDLNANLINHLRNHKAKENAAKSDLNTDIKNNVSKGNRPQLIAQTQTDPNEGLGDTLQNLDKLRQDLFIEPIIVPGEPPASKPGSTAGTPSAYGANWGQAFIGGGLNFPLEDGRTDGSMSVGFGLGNSLKAVGLEVTANITSVSTGDFGDSGGLGFKIHKTFKDGTAVAAGWSNVVKWGDSSNQKDTFYGVVTKAFELEPNNPKNKLPLTLSVGVGTGGFRSKGAIADDVNTPNVFGSVGLRVAPQVSLVTSWTGNRLNLGSSFALFPKVPVVVNTLFTDVTSNTRDGVGFSLSAGYAFQF